MNTRVLRALTQSFTHRDNPHGNRNSNIAFQRDLDERLKADGEYQANPSLPRLCYLVLEPLGKLVTEKSVDFVGFDNVVEFNKNRQNDDNVVKAYKS